MRSYNSFCNIIVLRLLLLKLVQVYAYHARNFHVIRFAPKCRMSFLVIDGLDQGLAQGPEVVAVHVIDTVVDLVHEVEAEVEV